MQVNGWRARFCVDLRSRNFPHFSYQKTMIRRCARLRLARLSTAKGTPPHDTIIKLNAKEMDEETDHSLRMEAKVDDPKQAKHKTLNEIRDYITEKTKDHEDDAINTRSDEAARIPKESQQSTYLHHQSKGDGRPEGKRLHTQRDSKNNNESYAMYKAKEALKEATGLSVDDVKNSLKSAASKLTGQTGESVADGIKDAAGRVKSAAKNATKSVSDDIEHLERGASSHEVGNAIGNAGQKVKNASKNIEQTLSSLMGDAKTPVQEEVEKSKKEVKKGYAFYPDKEKK